jgi:class 3 adenylate cyclase
MTRPVPDTITPVASETRTTRRLAAILAADVVGYSRMVVGDEAGTLAALKRHRETVFDPALPETTAASSNSSAMERWSNSAASSTR